MCHRTHRTVVIVEGITSGPDGHSWPHSDGLKWPHLDGDRCPLPMMTVGNDDGGLLSATGIRARCRVILNCLLTELRDVAAAQIADRRGSGVATSTGMPLSACGGRPDRGVGTAESGHPALNGSPGFSSLPLVDISSDASASVLACDDARTLKFTLIVQRMPMSGR